MLILLHVNVCVSFVLYGPINGEVCARALACQCVRVRLNIDGCIHYLAWVIHILFDTINCIYIKLKKYLYIRLYCIVHILVLSVIKSTHFKLLDRFLFMPKN